MKRDIHIFILMVVGLIFSLPTFAFDFQNGGLYYNILSETDRTVEVTYKTTEYNSYSGVISIPAEVTNNKKYRVVSVGNWAFRNCKELSAVSIPNSVKSIGYGSFKQCSNLRSISIPNSVESVGNSSFEYCTNLSEVELSENLRKIDDFAFDGCKSLTSFTIPETVDSIGSHILFGTNISSITIPENVKYIGGGISGNNLKEVVFNAKECYGKTWISSSMFEDVEKVTIGEGVKRIPEAAFQNSINLKEIKLPEGLLEISKWAFRGSGLMSLRIPNSVTDIGENAISGCNSLCSVLVGSGVLNMGQCEEPPMAKFIWQSNTPPTGYHYYNKNIINYVPTSFYTNLKKTSIYPYLSSLFEVEGIVYVPINPGKRTCAIVDCPYSIDAEHLTLDSEVGYRDRVMSVIEIMPFAFYYNTFIKSVDIYFTGNISDYAFYHCENISKLHIPSSIYTIGISTFEGCKNLSELIVDNTNSIGKGAFKECINLSDITVNCKGIIGENAFRNSILNSPAKLLITENVSDISPCSFSGCIGLTEALIFNSGEIGKNAFENSMTIESATLDIGPSVTNINEQAFSGCSALKILILSNTGDIKQKAFELCAGMESININTTGNITEYAFSECATQNKAQLYIGKGVTGIGKHAFKGCTHLTSIILENTGAIEESAFIGCSTQSSSKLIVHSSVTDIGEYSFAGCSALQHVTLDNTGSIGSYAFGSCAQVFAGGEIEITSNVTSIADFAFYNCSGFTSAQIYNTGDIGKQAFRNCQHLKEVTINNIGSIGQEAFLNSMRYSACTLVVGANVREIEEGAFRNCESLKTIDLNNKGKIGKDAFKDGIIKYLANLTVGSNVTDIMEGAFYGSYGLDEIHLNNLGSIGVNAFCNSMCHEKGNVGLGFTGTSTATLTIGENITEIDNSAFNGCHSLKILDLNNNGDIKNSAFANCTKLQTININNSGNIGELAFANSAQQDLATLYIGSKVKDVMSCAFSNCYAISDLKLYNVGIIGEGAFDGSATKYSACLVIGPDVSDIQNHAFWGCSHICSVELKNRGYIGLGAFQDSMTQEPVSLIIPETISDIYADAFRGCTSLKDVVINNVGTIGDNAFKGCASLEAAEFSSQKNIGNYIFSGCTSLQSVNLGEIPNIGEYAFEECTSLSTLNIPPYVKTIGDYAFKRCSSLKNIRFEEIHNLTDAESDSPCVITIGSNSNSPIFSDCPIEYVFIGRSLSYNTNKASGYSPFYGNTTLKYIEISDAESKVYDLEFAGCTNLEKALIGDRVLTVGHYAFNNCTRMEIIEFGRSVKSIGQQALSDCPSLHTLISHNPTPPFCNLNALTDIIFWDCDLHVPENAIDAYQDADQWQNFFIINDIIDSERFFYYRDSYYHVTDFDNMKCEVVAHTAVPDDILQDITGIDTIEAVEIPANVFYKGVGYSVVGINNGAFSAYTNLQEIILPETIEYLKNEAFAHCPLTTVDVRALVPPTAVENSFDTNVYASAELFTPAESKQAYKLADVWKNFVNTGVILGDSNDNGVVNIADAVNIANYVVGNEVDYFNFDASDINADSRITVSDASATITIILNQPVVITNDVYMRGASVSADRLVMDNMTRNGNRFEIPVTLEDTRNYVAVQGDIILPSGMNLESVSLGNRAVCHSLMTKAVGDNIVRFAIFDFNNNSFADTDDEILRLVVTADNSCAGTLSITNIVAADASAGEYALVSCEKGVSAISSSFMPDSDIVIAADGEGILVNNAAGCEVAVFTTDALQVARFIASENEERVNVAPGVYVVMIGNEVTKVIVK